MPPQAKTVLAKARSARGGDDGAKASTILQFRRLAEALGTDMEAFVDALGARNVAVFSGHMFRGDELDEAAQETTEAEIRQRAEAFFKAQNVGIVYGALAAGTDIILAETALKLGAELDIVLPFATERFIETSVKIGDPPGIRRQMGEALSRHSRREPRRSLADHHGSDRSRPIAISTAISSMPSAMRPGAPCSARRCCRHAAGWWWSPTKPSLTPSPAPTARSPIGASMGARWISFRFRTHAGSGLRSRAARTPSVPSCFCGTRRQTARTPRPAG